MKKFLEKYLDVSRTELRLFLELSKLEGMEVSVSELMVLINKERSTLQKNLFTLTKKGLVNRYKKNDGTHGNSRYIYTVEDSDKIKIKLKKLILIEHEKELGRLMECY